MPTAGRIFRRVQGFVSSESCVPHQRDNLEPHLPFKYFTFPEKAFQIPEDLSAAPACGFRRRVLPQGDLLWGSGQADPECPTSAPASWGLEPVYCHLLHLAGRLLHTEGIEGGGRSIFWRKQ